MRETSDHGESGDVRRLLPEPVEHRVGSLRAGAMLYLNGALTRMEPIILYTDSALTRMEPIHFAYVVFIITKP